VTNELRRSWLVQRLNTPHTGVWGKDKDNPFAFGGGLRNGGLSDTAMDLIRGIFSFDYMGAAEFEFGAVPTALDGLAKAHKQLVADTLTIPLADVARTWHDKSTGDPDGDALVYVLARAEHLDDVKQRITDIAAGNYQLKESTHLNAVLRPHADPDRWQPETAGWLELDNGFAFFTDRQMWQSTCELFGVAVPEQATA
jgi:hypothetical protein